MARAGIIDVDDRGDWAKTSRVRAWYVPGQLVVPGFHRRG